MAWTSGLVVEFRLLHTVVVGWISSGGDHGVHCWWDLIRSKQLFSAPYFTCRCVPDFLVMVIFNFIYIYIYVYVCVRVCVCVCAYRCVCVRGYAWVCVSGCIASCMWVCLHVCICVCACVHVFLTVKHGGKRETEKKEAYT